MRPLVVGISHRAAPAGLLERVALSPEAGDKLAADLVGEAGVTEAAVLSTCNRVEVYAAADAFHAGVESVTAALSRYTGVSVAELKPHLEVRWDRAAWEHAFAVAAGLESVVQGEPQILGQLRAALRRGQDGATVGPALHAVLQHALRVGKRVQSETAVGEAGRSLLSVALDLAAALDGAVSHPRALVVGAGSLAGLAIAELRRREAGPITVANRSLDRARRAAGPDGAALELADAGGLDAALVAADVVVSCTGAAHAVLSLAAVQECLPRRGGRPLVILDLSLPHDVDARVAGLPGVTILDLDAIADSGLGPARAEDLAAAGLIVSAELAAVDSGRRGAAAVPAVVALRTMAADVVAVELERLAGRTPDLSDADRAEVERTVHRVVEKLLHRPSVRVRELAQNPGNGDYGEALRQLFALDPEAVTAVTGEAPRW